MIPSKALEDLEKKCDVCCRHAQKPKRFKLTTGAEDLRFNHVVAADIMFIGGKPLLHVVDEATHFTSACWLRKSTSKEVWKALLRCWSNIYMGPPDFLRVDQGTNFISEEFKELADTSGITLLEAPIECPSSLSHVERYHGPLRKAYEKIDDQAQDESKTCLLYTSPSPRDQRGSRMPSSA